MKYQLTSLGKKGAIIDIEQKLMKFTHANDKRTSFCLRVKFLIDAPGTLICLLGNFIGTS